MDFQILVTWLQNPVVGQILRILTVLAVGLPVVKIISNLAKRAAKKRFTAQIQMLIKKGVLYTGVVIILITILSELGFNLTTILGAAGILGVAIGFASQTSFSNIISGLFLISEKPFEINDIVQIGNTFGVVLSIDLLAVKLKTFDNRFVRIPNETLIKSEVINISRFPIRRMDIDLGVAYKEDIRRVLEILKDIADKNPYSLDEPEPLIFFNNFGASALEIRFCLWFVKENFFDLRTTIFVDIKERLDAEGIEIPFPHRTLYTGEVTKPFPVKVVSGEEAFSMEKKS